MFVEMLETIGTAVGPYRRGEIYDVVDEIAADWTRANFARETTTPPAEVAKLFERLEDGAGKPCLFLPFTGEFGHQVLSHLRIVHFHRASEKAVACLPGEEVLYPSASGFVTNWDHPIPDVHRIGSNRTTPLEWPDVESAYPGHHPVKSGGLTPAQEIFAIHPEVPIPFRPKCRGLQADVVFGVRNRAYCPERNWQHWQRVADAMRFNGFTFAVIGHRSTSLDLAGQVCHSGDLDTDAAIELLQNCKLYVSTDCGASHLAATVGAPMLIFRETKSGSRDFTRRMQAVNPRPIGIVYNGWENPCNVIARAVERLEASE
jgi:hypothetical protein